MERIPTKAPTRIDHNIFRLTIPYKHIFTAVCAVNTEQGTLPKLSIRMATALRNTDF